MGRPIGSNNNSFSGSTLRPGYSGTSSSSVTARPGTRPNPSQGTYTPYGAGTRGRNSSGVHTGTSTRNSTPSRDSYNNSNRKSYNSNNRSSYNNSIVKAVSVYIEGFECIPGYFRIYFP